MHTSPRYYLVADDGSIRRLPRSTFHRIILQRTGAPSAEFHGKRVPFAEIVVQLDGRKPVAVQRASYGYLSFDANGDFDPSEWEAIEHAVIESWPSPTAPLNASLIDARARFADRRIALEHNWQPNDELREKLFAAATRGT